MQHNGGARRICVSCGHLAGIHAKACPYCGRELAYPARVRQCPQCSKPVSGTRLVCPHCQHPPISECVACRQHLADNWIVCPSCGALQAPIRAPETRSRRSGRSWVLWVGLACLLAAAAIYGGYRENLWPAVDGAAKWASDLVKLPRKP